ncbi:hypothetical protein CCMSSC00406_0001551 [Pleurotus cornucopiae]|uniref:Uncharacterized protein n=1 Tax=Pleurotus cornucopiae TaxID=5321 RepID=A0ACB7IQ10_PLECO|nr:hypothetical protein CCMSSC00406_0001551 [Pleurotus cornucopiae]
MDAPSPDTVQLSVELPSYLYSFTVDAPLNGSVADVKALVHQRCAGNPSVEGQRIIWRGRALGSAEKVEDLWKSPDSSRSVLLAVHPSGWTTTPPDIPSAPGTSSMGAPPPDVPASIHPLSARPPYSTPSPTPTHTTPSPTPPMPNNRKREDEMIPYVAYLHRNALLTLAGGRRQSPISDEWLAQSRKKSIDTLTRWGYEWPTQLDEEYPPAGEKDAGQAIYEVTETDGRQYLQLLQPHARPTATQIHALKILTYTFPVMVHCAQRRPDPTPTHTVERSANGTVVRIPLQRDQIHLPPNINDLLQQLGFPRVQLPAGANQRVAVNHVNVNVNAQNEGGAIADLPFRRLIVPLSMLLLRTVLLLYFVAPIRKPVFAALVIMWVTYEGWQAIRNWFGQLGRPAGQQPGAGAAAAQGGNNAVPVQGNQGNAPQPAAHGRPGAAAPRGQATIEQQVTAAFNTLSTMNIQTEDYFLNIPADRMPIQRISFLTKLTTFIILFFTTLHPAAWNRRRVALRQREGRIRTEAVIRNSEEREVEGGDEGDDNGERQRRSVEYKAFNERRQALIDAHARKPKWIKEYLERVLAGEWVDDAD